MMRYPGAPDKIPVDNHPVYLVNCHDSGSHVSPDWEEIAERSTTDVRNTNAVPDYDVTHTPRNMSNNRVVFIQIDKSPHSTKSLSQHSGLQTNPSSHRPREHQTNGTSGDSTVWMAGKNWQGDGSTLGRVNGSSTSVNGNGVMRTKRTETMREGPCGGGPWTEEMVSHRIIQQGIDQGELYEKESFGLGRIQSEETFFSDECNNYRWTDQFKFILDELKSRRQVFMSTPKLKNVILDTKRSTSLDSSALLEKNWSCSVPIGDKTRTNLTKWKRSKTIQRTNSFNLIESMSDASSSSCQSDYSKFKAKIRELKGNYMPHRVDVNEPFRMNPSNPHPRVTTRAANARQFVNLGSQFHNTMQASSTAGGDFFYNDDVDDLSDTSQVKSFHSVEGCHRERSNCGIKRSPSRVKCATRQQPLRTKYSIFESGNRDNTNGRTGSRSFCRQGQSYSDCTRTDRDTRAFLKDNTGPMAANKGLTQTNSGNGGRTPHGSTHVCEQRLSCSERRNEPVIVASERIAHRPTSVWQRPVKKYDRVKARSFETLKLDEASDPSCSLQRSKTIGRSVDDILSYTESNRKDNILQPTRAWQTIGCEHAETVCSEATDGFERKYEAVKHLDVQRTGTTTHYAGRDVNYVYNRPELSQNRIHAIDVLSTNIRLSGIKGTTETTQETPESGEFKTLSEFGGSMKDNRYDPQQAERPHRAFAHFGAPRRENVQSPFSVMVEKNLSSFTPNTKLETRLGTGLLNTKSQNVGINSKLAGLSRKNEPSISSIQSSFKSLPSESLSARTEDDLTLKWDAPSAMSAATNPPSRLHNGCGEPFAPQDTRFPRKSADLNRVQGHFESTKFGDAAAQTSDKTTDVTDVTVTNVTVQKAVSTTKESSAKLSTSDTMTNTTATMATGNRGKTAANGASEAKVLIIKDTSTSTQSTIDNGAAAESTITTSTATELRPKLDGLIFNPPEPAGETTTITTTTGMASTMSEFSYNRNIPEITQENSIGNSGAREARAKVRNTTTTGIPTGSGPTIQFPAPGQTRKAAIKKMDIKANANIMLNTECLIHERKESESKKEQPMTDYQYFRNRKVRPQNGRETCRIMTNRKDAHGISIQQANESHTMVIDSKGVITFAPRATKGVSIPTERVTQIVTGNGRHTIKTRAKDTMNINASHPKYTNTSDSQKTNTNTDNSHMIPMTASDSCLTQLFEAISPNDIHTVLSDAVVTATLDLESNSVDESLPFANMPSKYGHVSNKMLPSRITRESREDQYHPLIVKTRDSNFSNRSPSNLGNEGLSRRYHKKDMVSRSMSDSLLCDLNCNSLGKVLHNRRKKTTHEYARGDADSWRPDKTLKNNAHRVDSHTFNKKYARHTKHMKRRGRCEKIVKTEVKVQGDLDNKYNAKTIWLTPRHYEKISESPASFYSQDTNNIEPCSQSGEIDTHTSLYVSSCDEMSYRNPLSFRGTVPQRTNGAKCRKTTDRSGRQGFYISSKDQRPSGYLRSRRLRLSRDMTNTVAVVRSGQNDRPDSDTWHKSRDEGYRYHRHTDEWIPARKTALLYPGANYKSSQIPRRRGIGKMSAVTHNTGRLDNERRIKRVPSYCTKLANRHHKSPAVVLSDKKINGRKYSQSYRILHNANRDTVSKGKRKSAAMARYFDDQFDTTTDADDDNDDDDDEEEDDDGDDKDDGLYYCISSGLDSSPAYGLSRPSNTMVSTFTTYSSFLSSTPENIQRKAANRDKYDLSLRFRGTDQYGRHQTRPKITSHGPLAKTHSKRSRKRDYEYACYDRITPPRREDVREKHSEIITHSDRNMGVKEERKNLRAISDLERENKSSREKQNCIAATKGITNQPTLGDSASHENNVIIHTSNSLLGSGPYCTSRYERAYSERVQETGVDSGEESCSESDRNFSRIGKKPLHAFVQSEIDGDKKNNRLAELRKKKKKYIDWSRLKSVVLSGDRKSKPAETDGDEGCSGMGSGRGSPHQRSPHSSRRPKHHKHKSRHKRADAAEDSGDKEGRMKKADDLKNTGSNEGEFNALKQSGSNREDALKQTASTEGENGALKRNASNEEEAGAFKQTGSREGENHGTKDGENDSLRRPQSHENETGALRQAGLAGNKDSDSNVLKLSGSREGENDASKQHSSKEVHTDALKQTESKGIYNDGLKQSGKGEGETGAMKQSASEDAYTGALKQTGSKEHEATSLRQSTSNVGEHHALKQAASKEGQNDALKQSSSMDGFRQTRSNDRLSPILEKRGTGEEETGDLKQKGGNDISAGGWKESGNTTVRQPRDDAIGDGTENRGSLKYDGSHHGEKCDRPVGTTKESIQGAECQTGAQDNSSHSFHTAQTVSSEDEEKTSRDTSHRREDLKRVVLSEKGVQTERMVNRDRRIQRQQELCRQICSESKRRDWGKVEKLCREMRDDFVDRQPKHASRGGFQNKQPHIEIGRQREDSPPLKTLNVRRNRDGSIRVLVSPKRGVKAERLTRIDSIRRNKNYVDKSEGATKLREFLKDMPKETIKPVNTSAKISDQDFLKQLSVGDCVNSILSCMEDTTLYTHESPARTRSDVCERESNWENDSECPKVDIIFEGRDPRQRSPGTKYRRKTIQTDAMTHGFQNITIQSREDIKKASPLLLCSENSFQSILSPEDISKEKHIQGFEMVREKEICHSPKTIRRERVQSLNTKFREECIPDREYRGECAQTSDMINEIDRLQQFVRASRQRLVQNPENICEEGFCSLEQVKGRGSFQSQDGTAKEIIFRSPETSDQRRNHIKTIYRTCRAADGQSQAIISREGSCQHPERLSKGGSVQSYAEISRGRSFQSLERTSGQGSAQSQAIMSGRGSYHNRESPSRREGSQRSEWISEGERVRSQAVMSRGRSRPSQEETKREGSFQGQVETFRGGSFENPERISKGGRAQSHEWMTRGKSIQEQAEMSRGGSFANPERISKKGSVHSPDWISRTESGQRRAETFRGKSFENPERISKGGRDQSHEWMTRGKSIQEQAEMSRGGSFANPERISERGSVQSPDWISRTESGQRRAETFRGKSFENPERISKGGRAQSHEWMTRGKSIQEQAEMSRGGSFANPERISERGSIQSPDWVSRSESGQSQAEMVRGGSFEDPERRSKGGRAQSHEWMTRGKSIQEQAEMSRGGSFANPEKISERGSVQCPDWISRAESRQSQTVMSREGSLRSQESIFRGGSTQSQAEMSRGERFAIPERLSKRESAKMSGRLYIGGSAQSQGMLSRGEGYQSQQILPRRESFKRQEIIRRRDSYQYPETMSKIESFGNPDLKHYGSQYFQSPFQTPEVTSRGESFHNRQSIDRRESTLSHEMGIRRQSLQSNEGVGRESRNSGNGYGRDTIRRGRSSQTQGMAHNGSHTQITNRNSQWNNNKLGNLVRGATSDRKRHRTELRSRSHINGVRSRGLIRQREFITRTSPPYLPRPSNTSAIRKGSDMIKMHEGSNDITVSKGGDSKVTLRIKKDSKPKKEKKKKRDIFNTSLKGCAVDLSGGAIRSVNAIDMEQPKLIVDMDQANAKGDTLASLMKCQANYDKMLLGDSRMSTSPTRTGPREVIDSCRTDEGTNEVIGHRSREMTIKDGKFHGQEEIWMSFNVENKEILQSSPCQQHQDIVIASCQSKNTKCMDNVRQNRHKQSVDKGSPSQHTQYESQELRATNTKSVDGSNRRHNKQCINKELQVRNTKPKIKPYQCSNEQNIDWDYEIQEKPSGIQKQTCINRNDGGRYNVAFTIDESNQEPMDQFDMQRKPCKHSGKKNVTTKDSTPSDNALSKGIQPLNTSSVVINGKDMEEVLGKQLTASQLVASFLACRDDRAHVLSLSNDCPLKLKPQRKSRKLRAFNDVYITQEAEMYEAYRFNISGSNSNRLDQRARNFEEDDGSSVEAREGPRMQTLSPGNYHEHNGDGARLSFINNIASGCLPNGRHSIKTMTYCDKKGEHNNEDDDYVRDWREENGRREIRRLSRAMAAGDEAVENHDLYLNTGSSRDSLTTGDAGCFCFSGKQCCGNSNVSDTNESGQNLEARIIQGGRGKYRKTHGARQKRTMSDRTDHVVTEEEIPDLAGSNQTSGDGVISVVAPCSFPIGDKSVEASVLFEDGSDSSDTGTRTVELTFTNVVTRRISRIHVQSRDSLPGVSAFPNVMARDGRVYVSFGGGDGGGDDDSDDDHYGDDDAEEEEEEEEKEDDDEEEDDAISAAKYDDNNDNDDGIGDDDDNNEDDGNTDYSKTRGEDNRNSDDDDVSDDDNDDANIYDSVFKNGKRFYCPVSSQGTSFQTSDSYISLTSIENATYRCQQVYGSSDEVTDLTSSCDNSPLNYVTDSPDNKIIDSLSDSERIEFLNQNNGASTAPMRGDSRYRTPRVSKGSTCRDMCTKRERDCLQRNNNIIHGQHNNYTSLLRQRISVFPQNDPTSIRNQTLENVINSHSQCVDKTHIIRNHSDHPTRMNTSEDLNRSALQEGGENNETCRDCDIKHDEIIALRHNVTRINRSEYGSSNLSDIKYDYKSAQTHQRHQFTGSDNDGCDNDYSRCKNGRKSLDLPEKNGVEHSQMAPGYVDTQSLISPCGVDESMSCQKVVTLTRKKSEEKCEKLGLVCPCTSRGFSEGGCKSRVGPDKDEDKRPSYGYRSSPCLCVHKSSEPPGGVVCQDSEYGVPRRNRKRRERNDGIDVGSGSGGSFGEDGAGICCGIGYINNSAYYIRGGGGERGSGASGNNRKAQVSDHPSRHETRNPRELSNVKGGHPNSRTNSQKRQVSCQDSKLRGRCHSKPVPTTVFHDSSKIADSGSRSIQNRETYPRFGTNWIQSPNHHDDHAHGMGRPQNLNMKSVDPDNIWENNILNKIKSRC